MDTRGIQKGEGYVDPSCFFTEQIYGLPDTSDPGTIAPPPGLKPPSEKIPEEHTFKKNNKEFKLQHASSIPVPDKGEL